VLNVTQGKAFVGSGTGQKKTKKTNKGDQDVPSSFRKLLMLKVMLCSLDALCSLPSSVLCLERLFQDVALHVGGGREAGKEAVRARTTAATWSPSSSY